MISPIRYLAGLLVLIAALPVCAQTGTGAAAEEALSSLTMRIDGSAREFRAVAPFRHDEFLAASFSLDGSNTLAALHVITADGQIGGPIPVPRPLNYPGGRIDGLVSVGDAIIGIGHLAGGPDDRRGWIIRIEPDLSIGAQIALPLAVDNQTINYYYGGMLDERGRLIVAGRSDQPDFPGLGIRFAQSQQGLLQVAIAYPGGPAIEAGMRAGDVILRVDGRDMRGVALPEAIGSLAGPLGATVDLVIDRPGAGQRNFTLTRNMVTGLTTGVIAVLDPQTLEIVQPPKLIDHGTYRAGLQDIGRMRSGEIVGVGWWENITPDGGKFDKAWIVGFDSDLTKTSDQQFGAEGDNSIGQRVHLRPDGDFLVVGGLNARPEPVAFASRVTMDGGGTTAARLAPQREYAVGPGRTDVFRGITTLRDGSTILGGAFRSDEQPQFAAAAMVLNSNGRPTPLFEGCAQSYVWDMASTASDSIAVAGYCADADGQRRAALMWSPPREVGTDAFALANAQRIGLSPADRGQSFDLLEPESVLVFVPAGASGVLSLSEASGQLVDFASVDAGKAGLLAAALAPGRYLVEWASEGSGGTPRIDVVKAALTPQEPGPEGRYALAPDTEKALALLGYSAVQYEQDMPPGTQSTALTREIAAFQLSHDMPALGHVDIATEVALAFEGALEAEAEARDFVALAQRLAQSDQGETLASRFGPVSGHWHGEAFVGSASFNSLRYSGEWKIGDDGQLLPSGFGALQNLTSRESLTGMFRDGVFSGLGVTETTRDGQTRFVGTFDEQGRFTKGAMFENGRLTASGLFAPGGSTLVQDIPLPG